MIETTVVLKSAPSRKSGYRLKSGDHIDQSRRERDGKSDQDTNMHPAGQARQYVQQRYGAKRADNR
jgi:hypothetical protein